MLTSKQRFLRALRRETPDHLPATTHHVMPWFLERTLPGCDTQGFFDRFGLDPILWCAPLMPNAARGEYLDAHGRIVSDAWRVYTETLSGGGACRVERVTIATPGGDLTAVLEHNEQTTWIKEHFLKEKRDIALLGECVTHPVYDVAEINRAAAEFGERGLVRGTLMPCFDFFGQPGCWQDAACMFGIQRLIETALEDPAWVHELLGILLERKLTAAQSLAGAAFDLVEFGGGDASSTVISPALFDAFVAPFDRRIIAALHDAGQRVVYHTCGGMMPILERIVDMGPDAIETLTPPGMGGDTDLAEAKRRVGDRVCLIGGFDQYHFFTGCTPEATRAEVRRCFEAAGEGGGFILAPSDHFFEAEPALLEAFAGEARACTY